MIVCHCAVVNDRTITGLVEQGVRDLDELAEQCGAGGQCGGCRPTLAELVTRREAPLDAVAH